MATPSAIDWKPLTWPSTRQGVISVPLTTLPGQEGDGVSAVWPRTVTVSAGDVELHRRLGAELFNRVWDLLVLEDKSLPDGDRQRVFEPFVRLESSRNAATGGTGLGLTLVKAIVEGHGGEITLENKETGGLRARMHLPRMVTA